MLVREGGGGSLFCCVRKVVSGGRAGGGLFSERRAAVRRAACLTTRGLVQPHQKLERSIDRSISMAIEVTKIPPIPSHPVRPQLPHWRPKKSFFGQRALAATPAAAAAPPGAAAPVSTATGPTAAAAATPVVALSVARPPPGSSASAPARIVRLTTETLEVWSVVKGEGGGGGVGTETLEVRHPLAGQIQEALGGSRPCRLVDVAVIGTRTTSNHGAPTGNGGPVSSSAGATWGLDLLVLAAAMDGAAGGGEEGEDNGAFSVHAVRVSSEEASWVGSSVAVKVGVG